MNAAKSIERLQRALINSVNATPSAEMQTAFTEDLISEGGAADRNPFADATGFYRFQRLAFSFLSARQALQNATTSRSLILRAAGIPVSERLRIVQIQSWHHRYVARERLRGLVDLLKSTPEGTSLIEPIRKAAARYKKRSDHVLHARHRDVHEFDAHHPLIKQLELLELLSSPEIPDKDFSALMASQRKVVERKGKREIATELTQQESDFLNLTDCAFAEVFDLSPKWSFQSR